MSWRGFLEKIRKKSKAHTNGIKEGDVILSINGQSTSGRTHDESMAMVDASGDSLVMEVYRGDLQDLATVSPSTAVVNGTPQSEQTSQDNVTSSQTSQTFVDGDTTTKVETQSWVKHDKTSTTSAFVHKEETSTSNSRALSQSPVPFTVDSHYMSQPFTSKPVHVQVSAMFSDHSDDTKENVAPNRSASTKKAVPQFNVRKITTSQTQEDKWQPTDMFAAKQQKNLQEKQKYIQQQQQQQQQHVWQHQQEYQQQQYHQYQHQQQQQQWQPQQTSWDNAEHWKPERLEEWKPNLWAPGEEPPSSQEPPEEPRLSVQEIQKRLMAPKPVVKSFQPPQPLRQVDVNNLDDQPDGTRPPHRLPVFAPPVQITLEHDSAESDISSPSSSLSHKKLYSDSAFYDDPQHNYPTIQEQMKLCKAISQSLTAESNKKARGASMFAKRQKKSSRWIHDGEKSSSHGAADDIAYLSDLDSELHVTEGGTKPLFSFRIPKVKHRVKPPEQNTKMALSKDEFEKLRLNAKRCEHHTVAPNQCFDLAQSLKTNKGKAGRLFEKRRARSEKWVVDETNVKKPAKAPSNKLEDMLHAQCKPSLSPWEAALKNPSGDVDGAFDHLSEYERMQKLNQMLKYHPPEPPKTVQQPELPPAPIPRVTHLAADHHIKLLQGKDFNRKAKGWTGFQDDSDVYEILQPSQATPVKEAPPPVAPKPGRPAVHYGDYNPKLKAWHSPEPSMSSPSEYGGRVWTPTSNDSYYMNGSTDASPNVLSPTGYHPPPGALYNAQPMFQDPHSHQHMYNGGYAGHSPGALPGSDL